MIVMEVGIGRILCSLPYGDLYIRRAGVEKPTAPCFVGFMQCNVESLGPDRYGSGWTVHT